MFLSVFVCLPVKEISLEILDKWELNLQNVIIICTDYVRHN